MSAMTKKRPNPKSSAHEEPIEAIGGEGVEKTPDHKVYGNPVIGFRATPEMRAVIEALADEERRKVAQMLAILVEDALVARGKWPLKKRG